MSQYWSHRMKTHNEMHFRWPNEKTKAVFFLTGKWKLPLILFLPFLPSDTFMKLFHKVAGGPSGGKWASIKEMVVGGNWLPCFCTHLITRLHLIKVIFRGSVVETFFFFLLPMYLTHWAGEEGGRSITLWSSQKIFPHGGWAQTHQGSYSLHRNSGIHRQILLQHRGAADPERLCRNQRGLTGEWSGRKAYKQLFVTFVSPSEAKKGDKKPPGTQCCNYLSGINARQEFREGSGINSMPKTPSSG